MLNRELEAIVAISKGGGRLNEPLGERGRESKKEGGGARGRDREGEEEFYSSPRDSQLICVSM